MPFQYKMAIIMRLDIEISSGKAIAQGAHAAVACANSAKAKKTEIYKKWQNEGAKKVVLAVDDMEELDHYVKKARSMGLVTYLVMDAGLTEVPPGTVTCAGIGPDREMAVDKVTGSLPLYR